MAFKIKTSTAQTTGDIATNATHAFTVKPDTVYILTLERAGLRIAWSSSGSYSFDNTEFRISSSGTIILRSLSDSAYLHVKSDAGSNGEFTLAECTED